MDFVKWGVNSHCLTDDSLTRQLVKIWTDICLLSSSASVKVLLTRRGVVDEEGGSRLVRKRDKCRDVKKNI